MNEKIFVFIWFWLIVLSGVTVVSLLYHVFVMMTPAVTKVGGHIVQILQGLPSGLRLYFIDFDLGVPLWNNEIKVNKIYGLT